MDDRLQTQTMRMAPRRIFKCPEENRVLERKLVIKDTKGEYHCPSCGGRVTDVTDTETGKDFMEILGL